MRALALAIVLLTAGGAAAARRKVAVLEFRAGTQSVSHVGARLAEVLRRATGLEVVGPDDARRIGGLEIDAEVARCRGEVTCVSAVGAKLGVDEVVLAGVSELGDVILVLQRVGVQGGQVLARIAESVPKGKEPDAAALEGYLKRLLPREDFLRYGTLRIRANVEGAEVVIGGRARGRTPLEPIQVAAPARVDLRVSKAGYVPYTLQIDVPPEAVVEVKPVLTRREGAWYARWWVWAIAGGVAATAVVSTTLLLRDGSDTVSGTVVLPEPMR